MRLEFTKMQGCGNDYVYVNGMAHAVPKEERPALARRISDRHFGVGSDGLIFIDAAQGADFTMDMYNADGSSSPMCGNGIRCVGKYVYDKGLTGKTRLDILSGGAHKELELRLEGGMVKSVRVDMGAPILEPASIPLLWPGESMVAQPVSVGGREYAMTAVSMGNPHAVIFLDNVADLDLAAIGPAFEHLDIFPQRTNTEFVKIVNRGLVEMRVWERGSGETLACGTGACAVAVAGALCGLTDPGITVRLLGGELDITWDGHVFMEGPARTVFEGVWID